MQDLMERMAVLRLAGRPDIQPLPFEVEESADHRSGTVRTGEKSVPLPANGSGWTTLPDLAAVLERITTLREEDHARAVADPGLGEVERAEDCYERGEISEEECRAVVREYSRNQWEKAATVAYLRSLSTEEAAYLAACILVARNMLRTASKILDNHMAVDRKVALLPPNLCARVEEARRRGVAENPIEALMRDLLAAEETAEETAEEAEDGAAR